MGGAGEKSNSRLEEETSKESRSVKNLSTRRKQSLVEERRDRKANRQRNKLCSKKEEDRSRGKASKRNTSSKQRAA